MSSVAAIRCPGSTACGVRWGFVVALACLSRVADAGFVPAVPQECQSHASAWLTVLLNKSVTDVCGLSGMGVTHEAAAPSQPEERAPLKEVSFAGLLARVAGCGRSENSSGAAQTLTFTPLLGTSVNPGDPPPVSRLDAGENVRLPLKLPYKLFRPPKFV